MTQQDRTLLRVTAALLRGRVIPERVQDELAAALDRIAGVGFDMTEVQKRFHLGNPETPPPKPDGTIRLVDSSTLTVERPCPVCEALTHVEKFFWSDKHGKCVCRDCKAKDGSVQTVTTRPTFNDGLPPGCDTAIFTKDGIVIGKRDPDWRPREWGEDG